MPARRLVHAVLPAVPVSAGGLHAVVDLRLRF